MDVEGGMDQQYGMGSKGVELAENKGTRRHQYLELLHKERLSGCPETKQPHNESGSGVGGSGIQ